ncbi:unnamed protein product [Vicia faba]|uniref:U1-type domain-containing protein n=1 Tax=Vicia faba TaxID=3906 RepID=A0AAV1B5N8_VICFA|nr:unnamed protein product [Vicia faba]
MAFSFFLKLSFKFLHHFAWPLVALLYPLCASIHAIETDCYAETKNLISYWILLSFIYLFDYALFNLLPWLRLWLYIKLMIIFLLTIPDFGRASYVYNNLFRPMKLQIVVWRFNNYWRKCFVEKDEFLMHAERYMRENGTEALEKLIASKNIMCTPDAEVTNEIISTDSKEMLKTNGERLQTEHLDIKDLEAVEKRETPATKQDIPVLPKVGPSQSASSATVVTKGITENDRAGGEIPQSSSTLKEVQKEWTCALCLVTTSSEATLFSHLNGKKHMASCEAALKAKKQTALQKLKIYQPKEEVRQKNVNNMSNSNVKNGDGIVHKVLKVVLDNKVEKLQKNMSEPVSMHNSKLMCRVCDVVLHCENNVVSHLNGKKHLVNMQSKVDSLKNLRDIGIA